MTKGEMHKASLIMFIISIALSPLVVWLVEIKSYYVAAPLGLTSLSGLLDSSVYTALARMKNE